MKITDYKYHCTVGDLLDYIEKYNIPRDGKVLVQRVEDQYFEGCDISGMTGTLPDGSVGKLPEGSRATPWSTIKVPETQPEELKDEYIVAWHPVKHDDDNLYIDCHY